MMKLKGGDEKNSILAQAAKRMNLPMANTKGGNAAGNNNSASATNSGGNAPDASSSLAERLGMPSAMKQKKRGDNKDWSASQNRINMGAPVYIQSKSHQNRQNNEDDDEQDWEPRAKQSELNVHALKTRTNSDEDSDFEDEDDDELRLINAMRIARLQELKKTTSKQQQFYAMGHGEYRDVVQDAFLKEVTESKYVVCHFYHNDFERCKIVDKHLNLLAKRHLPTKFIKINAEKAPFFVGKLQIKMLPTIVLFKDGIAKDRIVGFEDVGATDDFTTEELEKRISKSGLLIAKSDDDEDKHKPKGSIRSSNLHKNMESDSDDSD